MRSLRTPLAVLATALLAAFSALAFATDTDSDGLSDAYEANFGTDSYDDDSDGDGWDDFKEVVEEVTDPNWADTDGDMISDVSDRCPCPERIPCVHGVTGRNEVPTVGARTVPRSRGRMS